MRRLKNMRRSLITAILIALIITSTGCSSQEYEVKIELSPEEAGGVIGEGTYAAGEEVELAAIVSEGYDFSNWELDGISILTEDKLVSYIFDEKLINLLPLIHSGISILLI